MQQKKPFYCLLLLCFFVGACASNKRPNDAMVFASGALKAAVRSNAERVSPNYFRKAENQMWKAKSLYLAKRYEECRKEAYLAQRYAERAEYDAELKGASGEAGGN